VTDQEQRLARVEMSVERIESAIMGINESLKTLTRLEERHAETRDALGRAFASISGNTARISAIETELPQMRFSSGLVMKGLVGIAVLVGIGILGMLGLK